MFRGDVRCVFSYLIIFSLFDGLLELLFFLLSHLQFKRRKSVTKIRLYRPLQSAHLLEYYMHVPSSCTCIRQNSIVMNPSFTGNQMFRVYYSSSMTSAV